MTIDSQLLRVLTKVALEVRDAVETCPIVLVVVSNPGSNDHERAEVIGAKDLASLANFARRPAAQVFPLEEMIAEYKKLGEPSDPIMFLVWNNPRAPVEEWHGKLCSIIDIGEARINARGGVA